MPGIVMEAVKSSNISRIGYDASTLVLRVEFLKGAVYEYYGVPLDLWEGLRSASSTGKYLHKEILGGKYAWKRIGELNSVTKHSVRSSTRKEEDEKGKNIFSIS